MRENLRPKVYRACEIQLSPATVKDLTVKAWYFDYRVSTILFHFGKRVEKFRLRLFHGHHSTLKLQELPRCFPLTGVYTHDRWRRKGVRSVVKKDHNNGEEACRIR